MTRGPAKGQGGRPRKPQGTSHSEGYIRVTVGPKGKGTQTYKHRAAKGLKKGDKRVVDHGNSNRKDNSKGNLKVMSRGANTAKSNRKRGS
jgi:hypothetical protein